MAVDKLVDSTQLDSDLTSVANAIRTKGGTSAQLAFPNGFVNAIGNIPAGGSPSWISKIVSITYMFNGITFDNDKETIDFDGAVITDTNHNANGTFANCNVEELIIKNLSILDVGAPSMFSGASVHTITKIKLENCTFRPSDARSMFQGQSSLTEIDGELDMTSCTSNNILNNMLYGCNVLTSIRFTKNSIKQLPGGFNSPIFDNDTLVNIGNALNDNVTGLTLTLRSTQKANCSTIMGTNDNGTFIADAQGSLSLADFITNVKGWTLA